MIYTKVRKLNLYSLDDNHELLRTDECMDMIVMNYRELMYVWI